MDESKWEKVQTMNDARDGEILELSDSIKALTERMKELEEFDKHVEARIVERIKGEPMPKPSKEEMIENLTKTLYYNSARLRFDDIEKKLTDFYDEINARS